MLENVWDIFLLLISNPVAMFQGEQYNYSVSLYVTYNVTQYRLNLTIYRQNTDKFVLIMKMSYKKVYFNLQKQSKWLQKRGALWEQ